MRSYWKVSTQQTRKDGYGAVYIEQQLIRYFSGKSSLILTLLGLLEVESGSVYIDGLDLSTLSRDSIRTHIITIPQDPVKLSGTVRQNIDPSEANLLSAAAGENNNARLILALTRVGMWDLIHDRGGLDADFSDMNLSQGQQQLFCLARAIHRREQSKIVLLDEPTSSVDRETDQRVLKVIHEEFKHCTVIAVAHRLETIIDSDLIVVMDAGRIQEAGKPNILLEQPGSGFKALWDSRNG